MAPALSAAELGELPRPALVQLAKERGLRANAKTSSLIQQLAASRPAGDTSKTAKRPIARPPTASHGTKAVSHAAQKFKAPNPVTADKGKKKEPVKKRQSKGRISGPHVRAHPSAPAITHDVERLVHEDQQRLEREASAIAGGNVELMRSFEAKLAQHKRDILAQVEALLRASEAETSELPGVHRRRDSPLTTPPAEHPLLPPVDIATSQQEKADDPPSPFVAAMDAGSPPARVPPRSKRTPGSPGKRKRPRTASHTPAGDVTVVGPDDESYGRPSPHSGPVRKRARVEGSLQPPPAPRDDESHPSLSTLIAQRSPSIFSFFTRTPSGTQTAPPPPLSPPLRRNAPISELPFPLGTKGDDLAKRSLHPVPATVPPVTPPASRTLFGTEREGSAGRFGDLGHPTPGRTSWLNSLLSRNTA